MTFWYIYIVGCQNMHCTLPTSSTVSECSSSSSHELQPETGPSSGGMIGMASALMPFGVIWWLRKWSSHIWCWSDISRSVSRKAASHTFTRALSLGKLKNLLRGRPDCSPGLRALWFRHPWTTHFTIVATRCQITSLHSIKSPCMCNVYTHHESKRKTRCHVIPVWPIKWLDFSASCFLYWTSAPSDI